MAHQEQEKRALFWQLVRFFSLFILFLFYISILPEPLRFSARELFGLIFTCIQSKTT